MNGSCCHECPQSSTEIIMGVSKLLQIYLYKQILLPNTKYHLVNIKDSNVCYPLAADI